MSDYPTCKTCKYWDPDTHTRVYRGVSIGKATGPDGPWGFCKCDAKYATSLDRRLSVDVCGPSFGCVYHEPRRTDGATVPHPAMHEPGCWICGRCGVPYETGHDCHEPIVPDNVTFG